MRAMFIPPLGTEVTLAKDWTFKLFRESRNDTLVTVLGFEFPDETDYWLRKKQNVPVTLPAGTTLKIDRIYIRKGQNDFDSVTFFLKGARREGFAKERSWRIFGGPRSGESGSHEVKVPAKSVRFWAKLDDVNRMVLEGEAL